MAMLSIAAILIHGYIILKGALFFRSVGTVHENDKVLVASLMALSGLFILAVGTLWLADPQFESFHGQGGMPMLGFVFSETFFNLAIVTALTRSREAKACQQPRD